MRTVPLDTPPLAAVSSALELEAGDRVGAGALTAPGRDHGTLRIASSLELRVERTAGHVVGDVVDGIDSCCVGLLEGRNGLGATLGIEHLRRAAAGLHAVLDTFLNTVDGLEARRE